MGPGCMGPGELNGTRLDRAGELNGSSLYGAR